MKGRFVIAAVLGALAVASIGAVAVLAAAPGPSYLHVESWSAGSQNENAVRLSVTTGGDIARQADAFIGSNPVVGLAWADLDTGKAFVATVHPVLGRDSNQNPNSWHGHTATLSGGATPPNDFCVASIDSTPTAGIRIQDDTMTVNVRADELPVAASAFDAAVGFTIQPDAACASGLAVRTIA